MARIELNEVHKKFGAVEVIKGVDLDIEDREFVVFVGPSGCGKSTMLRLIAGLEEASSGAIVIDGDDVTALSASERQLSMVFQSYALYPHMTVAQNLAFGLKMAGRPAGEITEKVGRAADILQLGPLMERQPKALSGGQRQRVAIGRSIVRDPRAFLFDEPLSNLDASLRVQMRIEIARLHRRLAATMIYVTHDQVEAMTLADRIVVFSGGTIEQVGAPIDLYRNPSNLFVATFIGSPQMNILDCGPANGSAKEVRLGSGDAVSVATTVSEAAPAARLGIRPEHIDLAADGGGHVSGVVGVSERLGSDSFLYVDVDGAGTITVRISGERDIAVGETVSLRFQEAQIHLFDGDGKALTSR